MNKTPRTNEWETYCDECYYHMWRVRRKNERGFDDGFHLQNGNGANQLVELLNKQDDELTTVTEQRDRLAEEVGQLKSRLTQTMGAVTISRNGYVQELEQQRDRLAESLRNIMGYRKGEKPYDYYGLPFEERENAAFDGWMQIENNINQTLQSLTPKRTMNTPTPKSDKAKIAFTSLFANDDAYWIPYVVGVKLETELTAVTEQRDRLAVVVQGIRSGFGGQIPDPACDCGDCAFLITIDNALQYLTKPN
jgi:hypothetical protein